MTEQEKLHHAKHYIDSLANGVNPLDGTPIPEQDIVNNVKISRCLFFVSDVLRKQLDGAISDYQPLLWQRTESTNTK